MSLHIEKLYTSTMDPKFPEKMSILMSWQNLSLRDVTEGHFKITILDTYNIFNKQKKNIFLIAIYKGRLLGKVIDFDSSFWSKTKLFLFFCHGGTSHGGTFCLSLEHSPSGDFFIDTCIFHFFNYLLCI